jgi:8-oxo-dGTP diphosphatase
MKNTTLCYIEKDGMYLMMHRNKKKNDENEGKYIGVGGHFEENESPFDCIVREAKEETGLDIVPKYRGVVTFVSNVYETQQMHLFTCDEYSGEIAMCNEGELKWIKKSELNKIPLWEGDKIFLDLLSKNAPFFSLKLVYENDTLTEYVIK